MIVQEVVALIGGSRPFLSDDEIDMYIGVITNESASLPAEVTSHAVEEGSSVQSHVKISSESFSISIRMGGAYSLVKAIYNSITSPKMSEFSVEQKISKLRDWRDKKQLLTYSGPKAAGLLYQTRSLLEENLIITGLEESRNNKSDAWDISLSFQRMRIVRSKMIQINLPVSSQASKSGGQSTAKQDSSTKASVGSILNNLTKG